MKRNTLIGLVAIVGLAGVGTALLSKDTSSKPEGEVLEVKEDTTKTLPSEVTDNFPLYPKAEISKFTNSAGEDGRIFYTVSLVSADEISTINTWYRQAFGQNGWSLEGDNNVGGYQIIKGQKDNLVSSMQAAKGEAGKVVISQQIQIRPK